MLGSTLISRLRPAPRAKHRLRRVLCVALTAPIVACALFAAAVAWWPCHSPAALPASTFVLDRNGIPLAALAARDGTWNIPLEEAQISPHLAAAIVAVEDARFYEHHGVDWRAVIAAAWQDLRAMHPRRGASTLTMQVQHLRDPGPRTLANKVEQAVRAYQLERSTSKRQLLCEYVNRAPFGGNLVGAGAASWRYFGKPCRELSLGEAALLAGLPQSPNRYRPDRFPQRAMVRRDHVLARMCACGIISEAQRREAAAEPLLAAWRPLPQDMPFGALPPADGALPTLLGIASEYPSPIIPTTLDAAIQRQAALATREHLRQLSASGVSAAAVVVLDTQSARCLASVSMSDDNGATRVDFCRAARSTGSAIKPLIYAAAFEAGVCSPSTLLDDSPTAWPGYEPANYDRQFRGTMTAAEALAQSRNIPAMLVLAKLGVEPAIGILEGAGFRTLLRSPRRYGLSLAIGGAEATPLEMAEAYATLARGGTHKSVTFRITPNQVLPYAAVSARCISEVACWQTLAALSMADRTAHACPGATRTFAAWKTGTSSGHRDAWCAAVTPRRTIVVWLGNPCGEGSPLLIGQEAAAPLALQLIASLDPGPYSPWPVVAKNREIPAAPCQPFTTTITLVSPAPGTRVIITPDLSSDQQRVLLKGATNLRGNDSSPMLWWFVDDKLVGDAAANLPVWWPPTIGSHSLRVVDAAGHAASSRIEVCTVENANRVK